MLDQLAMQHDVWSLISDHVARARSSRVLLAHGVESAPCDGGTPAYTSIDGTAAAMRVVELDGMFVRGQFLIKGSTAVPVLIGADGAIPVECVPEHFVRNTTGLTNDQSKVAALLQHGTSLCIDGKGALSMLVNVAPDGAAMSEEAEDVGDALVKQSFLSMLARHSRGALARWPHRGRACIQGNELAKGLGGQHP